MTDPTPAAPHFVVVGVDGSPSSVDALRWAAKQAELTGAVLRVVTAWQMPTAYGVPIGVLADYNPEATAREVLQETLDKAGMAIPVDTEVVHGTSAAALVDAAAGADLLVVGSRGHGELVGALLGSVSAYTVAHAPCPVVVVHHSETPATDQPPSA